jgi:hypothetical protein
MLLVRRNMPVRHCEKVWNVKEEAGLTIVGRPWMFSKVIPRLF